MFGVASNKFCLTKIFKDIIQHPRHFLFEQEVASNADDHHEDDGIRDDVLGHVENQTTLVGRRDSRLGNCNSNMQIFPLKNYEDVHVPKAIVAKQS